MKVTSTLIVVGLAAGVGFFLNKYEQEDRERSFVHGQTYVLQLLPLAGATFDATAFAADGWTVQSVITQPTAQGSLVVQAVRSGPTRPRDFGIPLFVVQAVGVL